LPLVVAMGGLIMAGSVIVIMFSEWLRMSGDKQNTLEK
jgi:hypothetical protein